MARRHGSGAVKRRSDGRWEGQLRLADGSRKYIYARNRRELITRLQEERWRARLRHAAPGQMPLAGGLR